jgi:hypothetical protein
MKVISERSRDIPVADEVDVLVVGGGPAGVGAALSAARLGARTLIVEQSNCLGGVATSGGHNHFSLFTSWDKFDERIVGGVAEEMRQRLLKGGHANYRNGCLDFDMEALKLILDQMMADAAVNVRYYTLYAGTLKEGATVTGGIVQNKSGRQAILAQRMVDCTGDADAAYDAGAAFFQGRPQDGRCQPCTLMFTIANVDWPKVAAWRSSFQMREVWLKAQDDGIMEPFQSVIMGFWHTDALPDQVGINMTNVLNVDTTNAQHLTDATIEGRRQAHHLVEVFRKVVPGMDRCRLVSTAPLLGLRESRRIVGKVTLSGADLMAQRHWPDAVGYGSFYIDIHNPAGTGLGEETWYPSPGFRYQIPYTVMVPEKTENLLVAGRCISADHVALGSTRIMSTCMVLGEAAGAAAVLSLHEALPPARLEPRILQAQLRRQGAILDEAGIRAASAGEGASVSDGTPAHP